MAVPVESFFLDPEAPGTLQARIQQMVAEEILSGRLKPGEKLPSTRRLAAHLGVSRITVTLAYAELLANDYLTARGRSGFYVSQSAPRPAALPPAPAPGQPVDWQRTLARRASGGAGLRKPRDWRRFRFPFIYGQPDPALFDHSGWRQCAIRALGQKDIDTLTADQHDADDPLLVEFIARHILPRRGIRAGPDEILVTLGAQNALWLTAQLLLSPERAAAVEDPSYPALRDILAQTGCRLLPVPVDGDGLPPEAIPEGVAAIFTTPSHQCPTSATMPRARRRAILDRARQLGAVVVEDDYEFEMAYLKAPLPALKSLDADGRVIYAGSFSKALFPGLRLGYLVGPAPFIAEARALRAAVLRHAPGHTQRTAAYYLSLGHYDAQIQRLGRALAARREEMERAIRAAGLEIAGAGAHGGSSFWIRAPEGIDSARLAERLARREVLIEPGAAFFSAGSPGAEAARHFRLGYGSIPRERIREGIARIAEEIAAMRTEG
ncbi:GntR family transcriptional regulator / MocR family aminotransferase [Meinhardsimonia xiamenensis]|jgi:GntR family transcriptional regulator/MocR family aminotransferase|uniref:GntR family transcriptional regulator / MocR family aminotransferase n=1 Tax=Meinhardsimonia xiamenensis TaxID=990712 RepID=A0A1G9GGB7_9RHOB|nr:PLP-dependent aminotransferase family protein [Meinhardsimonia xiamenensis]PRX31919.1 GntR family transcriptional regulator/MocR family aminotransferase [Meinhardsimonia xiamenensis]SDK99313.1 GntR family transcriptional regulator / MocR family aminotransferase [Meinhardsimonia xiamenensis]